MPDSPILVVYIGGVYLFAAIFGYSLFVKRQMVTEQIDALAEMVSWPRWATYLFVTLMFTFGWFVTLTAIVAMYFIDNRK